MSNTCCNLFIWERQHLIILINYSWHTVPWQNHILLCYNQVYAMHVWYQPSIISCTNDGGRRVNYCKIVAKYQMSVSRACKKQYLHVGPHEEALKLLCLPVKSLGFSVEDFDLRTFSTFSANFFWAWLWWRISVSVSSLTASEDLLHLIFNLTEMFQITILAAWSSQSLVSLININQKPVLTAGESLMWWLVSGCDTSHR